MGKRLLVLHGPNLNLLGEREGRQGGRLADLDAAVMDRAAKLGLELKVVQSNHEGVLIDTLHAERSRLEGVVVSPAGLFGSHPLREALEAVGVPAIEVYLERLGDRESVVAEACAATLEGQGFQSYLEALERFASGDLTGELSEEDSDEEDSDEEDSDEEDSDEEGDASDEPVKTLGRRKKAATQVRAPAPAKAVVSSSGGGVKTLGRKAEVRVGSPKPGKTLGRKAKDARDPSGTEGLSRELVRRKIQDRLAGRSTPAELSAWARVQWLELQKGGVERSDQALLEDCLQRLTLSTFPASKLSDAQLVDMMTRLDG